MSKLGYAFESYIEKMLLDLDGKKRSDPILKSNGGFARSFRVPGSGAMAAIKGDCISSLPWLDKQLKIECKHHFKETVKDGSIFVVPKEWLDKNEEEAIADNQLPILTIRFKRCREAIWFILDDYVLKELLTNRIKNTKIEYTALTWGEEVHTLTPRCGKKKKNAIICKRDIDDKGSILKLMMFDKVYWLLNETVFIDLISKENVLAGSVFFK